MSRHLARKFNVYLLALSIWVAICRVSSAKAEVPLCHIAAISNPYITVLSAKELGSRGWLAEGAPAGLAQALAAVKRVQPDALCVLGSLTWTGSDADFARCKELLAEVRIPVYVTPGEKDLVEGGMDRFRKHFAAMDVSGQLVSVKGIRLLFGSARTAQDATTPDQALASMRERLQESADAPAVLLVGGPTYAALVTDQPADPLTKQYWELVHRYKVAAQLVSDHAHTVTLQDSLPIWSIPSSGWSYSPKWSVALVTVYTDRVELSLLRDEGQPPQSLVVPNPVARPRLPRAADDPYRLPTYSEDLARKPQLTFVQLSDSQFDDKTVPRYRDQYQFDEQMSRLAVTQVNRLQPPLVFMTGDLTNKNTPREWETFRHIYSVLKPPLYTLPGNHDTLYPRADLTQDVLGDLYESGVQNWKLADELAKGQAADRAALYRHFTGREPYYTVEKNDCVFICLNTGVATVDREQLDWLRRELDRTKSARHVMVLGHYPVLPVFGGNVAGPEGHEIIQFLKEYKVAAYLSGHRHRYDYRLHDGTAHVLCDCLCWGEYLSYQIYHVFPDKIISCWKPIFRADGNRPLYERVEFPEPRFRG